MAAYMFEIIASIFYRKSVNVGNKGYKSLLQFAKHLNSLQRLFMSLPIHKNIFLKTENRVLENRTEMEAPVKRGMQYTKEVFFCIHQSFRKFQIRVTQTSTKEYLVSVRKFCLLTIPLAVF